MKKTYVIILLILFFIPKISKCQKDSIQIHKFNDTYIEIKTLRYKLDSSYYDAGRSSKNGHPYYPSSIYIPRQFVPQPIVIRNGTVIIKNREDKPLDIYIYSDSVVIQHDRYYKGGRLQSQMFNFPNDSLEIDRYYNINGYLEHATYKRNNLEEIFRYSEKGLLLEQGKYFNNGISEILKYSEDGQLIEKK